MSTNPWGAFHWFCIVAIAVTVWDVSGISKPRSGKLLPQIQTEQSGIDQVQSLLKNLEHLK